MLFNKSSPPRYISSNSRTPHGCLFDLLQPLKYSHDVGRAQQRTLPRQQRGIEHTPILSGACSVTLRSGPRSRNAKLSPTVRSAKWWRPGSRSTPTACSLASGAPVFLISSPLYRFANSNATLLDLSLFLSVPRRRASECAETELKGGRHWRIVCPVRVTPETHRNQVIPR